jgi:hypothetical protein
MSETRYRKGDLVRFRFGLRNVDGKITEDIGGIGFKMEPASTELSYIELPVVDFDLVQAAASKG